MKKVLFLQLESNAYGGVWFVNKTLGEKFIELGYEVKIIGVRKIQQDIDLGKTKIKIDTVNTKNEWKFTNRRDVINSIKYLKFFQTFFRYIIDFIK